MVESRCNQSRALINSEAGKRQNFEAKLADVQCRLDDHSSLPCFSHEMFRYEVNRGLHYYFHPLFDAMRERTAAFRSVLSSQSEPQGEALHQRSFSIILSLD